DVDAKGKVNGGVYATPNATNTNNYLTAKPTPVLPTTPSQQLSLSSICATREASITANSDDLTPSIYNYKWQVSTDAGITWNYITSTNAGSVYTNYTTKTLGIKP